MSLAGDLWQMNQDLARACLDHPFVQGLARGDLPRERFAAYVSQDAFFLEAFARGYCIAAARVPDWQGFTDFYEIAGGVLDELRLHESYAAAWGVDVRSVKPAPATRHYTDFLLATAWGHDAGLTAAALTPCMRLYAYLGQQLARGGVPDHDYADWIQTYSSPDFEALASRLEGLVDRYAQPGPDVESVYRYAMVCERNFFTSAWEGGEA